MSTDENTTPAWEASSAYNSSDGTSDVNMEQTIPIGTAVFQLILGAFIILGNSFVIVVLRHVSTLTGITRVLLGNLAVADIIFGGCAMIRGVFVLAEYEARYYCAHLMGLGVVGLVATYGTASIITGHVLYMAAKGPAYRDAAATRYVYASQVAVWLLSSTFYGLSFLFLTDSEATDCTASSGQIHRVYFQLVVIVALCFIAFSLVGQVGGGVLLNKMFKGILVPPSHILSESNEPCQNNVVIEEGVDTERNAINNSVQFRRKTTKHQIRIVLSVQNEVVPVEAPPSGSSGVSSGTLRNRRNARRKLRQKRHTFVIIVTVSVCLFITASPNLVVQGLNAFAPHVLQKRFLKLPAACTTIALLNSLMNVVIYFIKDRCFRQRSKRILKKLLCRS